MERKADTSRRKGLCLLIFSGLALFLDVTSSRSYYEYDAWTKEVGRFFFHGLAENWGIPLPTTVFEFGSYALFIVMLGLWGLQSSRVWRALTLCALLIPVAAIAGFLFGLVEGHSAGLGARQLRSLPFLCPWLFLGYFMGVRAQVMQTFFRMVFAIALWRSIYGLYIFATFFDFQMGEREYLIDHFSSIVLAAGLLYAAQQIFVAKDLRVKYAYIMALLPMGWAFVLNDRRTSFAGVLAFGFFLPWIVPIGLRRRILPYYRWGAVMAVLGILVLGLSQIDTYGFLGGFKTEFAASEQLTYRHMENFNLLTAVVREPWTGLGFGTSYPQVMQLPDISSTFALFAAIPHNSVYFLWAFSGPFGIACLASLTSMAFIVIIRCGRWAQTQGALLHAFFGLLILCQWLMYAFYDMGLFEVRNSMLFGIVIGSLFPQYAHRIKEHYHAQLTSAHPDQPPALAEQPSQQLRPLASRR